MSRPGSPHPVEGSSSFVKSRRFSEAEVAADGFSAAEVRRCLSSGGVRLLASAPSEVEEGEALLRPSRLAHSRALVEKCIFRPSLPTSAAAVAKSFSSPLLVALSVAALCAVATSLITVVTWWWGSEAPQEATASLDWAGGMSAEGDVLQVAIVGGGLAGATTALELLATARGRRMKITILEQSPSLLASTSSMIAATMNLDTGYRYWLHGKAMFSVFDMVRNGFSATALSSNTRWANFLLNAASKLKSDPRSTEVQKRKVFRKSYTRLVQLVTQFPELCGALIGHWCCDAGEAPRRHLEHVAGVACPRSEDPAHSPLGLFQLTGDPEICAWMAQAAVRPVNGCDDEQYTDFASCEAAGHTWQDVAYSFYNASETHRRLSGFLGPDSNIACSLVEHRITGFARSEVLFSILGDLFRSAGVALGLSCNVLAVEPADQASGRIRVTTDSAVSECGVGTREFDRVVVAAAAASVPLLVEIDPMLRNHLVGVKGYGLSGAAEAPKVPASQSGRGLHLMDMSRHFAAAYVRTTDDLRVKVWGGHDVSATDAGVQPPYEFCDAVEEERIFRDGPACARALVDLPSTTRLTGMRPVPSIGNMPLIKRYTGKWRNLILNSGYGYNGYDLAWFASNCTAQWLMSDSLDDAVCLAASKLGPEV